MPTLNPYRGFRYPAEVIQHAIWLHHCFSLSLRDVETILAARSIVVSYETIRAAGAKLIFLPPYSPDLNPIEQAISQLEILLRKENARTQERVTECIGKLLDRFTPKASANYFRKAG